MSLLLPILSVCLASLLSLLLIQNVDWSHRASEQNRIDALTLSVCHHRAHFLRSSIGNPNAEIRNIQREMDQAANTCDTTELTPAGPEICAASLVILKALTSEGWILEIIQNRARELYVSESAELFRRLKLKNALSSESGDLVGQTPAWMRVRISDGLTREVHGPQRQRWQIKYQTAWPQRLEAAMNFSEVHQVDFEFRPLRKLEAVSSEDSKALQDVVEKPATRLGLSTSFSGCEIDEQNFQVRRTR